MVTKIKTFFPILLIVVFVAVGIYFLAKSNDAKISSNLPTSYEYYWGNGCKYCAKVAEFLETWDGRDKVALEKKEVWSNQINYRQMQARAEYCKLDKNQLGVPLLFTPDGKCFVGDQPIIEILKAITY